MARIISWANDFETVCHKYLEKEVVGKGLFGIVVKYESLKDGQVFAAKKIDKRRAQRRLAKSSMKVADEVEILKLINHKNCMSLVEVVESHTHLILILEYIAGGELLHCLAEHDVELSENEKFQVGKGILQGLEYLHSQRIVHRDLKPENVLLNNHGQFTAPSVKIIDFGLAYVHKEGADPLCSIVGSVNYMSPEILNGDGASFPSDVWACGCILYLLLTGEDAFDGADRNEVSNQLQSYKEVLAWKDNDISIEGKELCKNLLLKNPRKRPIASDALKSLCALEPLLDTIEENADEVTEEVNKEAVEEVAEEVIEKVKEEVIEEVIEEVAETIREKDANKEVEKNFETVVELEIDGAEKKTTEDPGELETDIVVVEMVTETENESTNTEANEESLPHIENISSVIALEEEEEQENGTIATLTKEEGERIENNNNTITLSGIERQDAPDMISILAGEKEQKRTEEPEGRSGREEMSQVVERNVLQLPDGNNTSLSSSSTSTSSSASSASSALELEQMNGILETEGEKEERIEELHDRKDIPEGQEKDEAILKQPEDETSLIIKEVQIDITSLTKEEMKKTEGTEEQAQFHLSNIKPSVKEEKHATPKIPTEEETDKVYVHQSVSSSIVQTTEDSSSLLSTPEQGVIKKRRDHILTPPTTPTTPEKAIVVQENLRVRRKSSRINRRKSEERSQDHYRSIRDHCMSNGNSTNAHESVEKITQNIINEMSKLVNLSEKDNDILGTEVVDNDAAPGGLVFHNNPTATVFEKLECGGGEEDVGEMLEKKFEDLNRKSDLARKAKQEQKEKALQQGCGKPRNSDQNNKANRLSFTYDQNVVDKLDHNDNIKDDKNDDNANNSNNYDKGDHSNKPVGQFTDLDNENERPEVQGPSSWRIPFGGLFGSYLSSCFAKN